MDSSPKHAKPKCKLQNGEHSVMPFLAVSYFFSPSPEDMLIDFRGGEGEREGEEHQSVASCTRPDWRSNPQLRHVPRPGIEPATFQFIGQHSN